ncbi:MAG TPA: VWA domain-containing protein, partial [Gammaproteobacteria bacterium]|nr:VWA domain-containing protein [Gammaproteobacteria bacterium]
MFISASLRNYTRGASAFFVLLASLALSACGGGGGGGGDTGGGGGGTGGTGGGGTTSYTVGGTVSGLAGSLVLQNNGGDNLTITADGNFTFTTAVADGASYAVTVSSQPTGQTCTVSNASGAVSGANISNVSVSCANSGSGFTIGGTVNGLTGSLVLQNAGNNESLTVSADGGFTFTQSLADGEGYVVTVVTQPTGASCVVTNGSGSIASANVSNITISCSSRNLGFVSYGITTEAPSIVSSAFRVVDKASGTPVTGLGVDDFQVLEDGGVITQLESFKDLEPIDNIPYVFYTVLALDISSSLSLADIQQVKDTAKAIIADPVTGASKLQTNQQVAIYTFDGTVTQVAAFTSNVDTLLTAIDGISRGGPSTNLYGAIVTGMGRWVDSFSLSNVTYGAMVVVTDGDDTSGVYTEQDAINAVGNKLLYAIPVGSNVNQTTLENIAGVDHVFPATDFSELGTVFDQVTTELGRFSDGLYFLYYASPKRAGTHTIDVSIVGNTNTGTDASISGTFSAAGFSDVTPEVIISGDDY